LAKPTTISLESIISVAAGQVSCELDGEAAILNLTSGTYYGLDPVGATVWSLISGPIAVREVVDAITAQFDVDRACCERDLLALFAQLDERGLIQIGDGDGR
jgi:coenzyme PQQ synthesis protein D (PqqD)